MKPEDSMGLLNEKDARIVGERLSRLPRAVTVALFTSEKECALCLQTRELLEELAAVSGGKVVLELHDLERDREMALELGIDKVPGISIRAEGDHGHGIRFFGIPAGYEFASLLETMDMMGRGDSGLAPATREKLKTLRGPLDLQVFVTPTCPYCPRAVLTAFRFAMESDLVRASMVEATEFPELSGRYGVSGVPHTVIGNSPQAMIGAYPEAAAVDMVVAASRA
jgi:glutaredoxin-like protein